MMKAAGLLARILLVLTFGCACSLGASEPSTLLTKAGCKKLKQLIQDDPEADARFAEIQKNADSSLPDRPNPDPVLSTEGRLAGDPIKIRTWKSIADFGKMQSLAYAWVVTAKPDYLNKVSQFLLAWAAVNHSKGNPIDDTNLEGLIVAYDLTRDSFPDDQRQKIDAYLSQVAAAEMKSGEGTAHTTVNNWNSHRLKVEGLIAFTLHDARLIQHVVDGFHRQVAVNLLPDGSSIDFHERDALHYHEYDLTPLVTLAIAARNNGLDFYHYQSPSSSSLAGSVAFMVPYMEGIKTHPEFVNSKVPFDRQRAQNGESQYKPGRLWDPRGGLPTIDHAELFDPTLLPLIIKLTSSSAQRFPTWQTVLNAANG
jgi:hypothetical protein